MQHIDDDDADAVRAALLSDWLTDGPNVRLFEEQVAAYCDARSGVAVSSGTAALHVALKALDVKPGDRVWTSPNSFVATANCALYCGATIDFVDIDPLTYNLGAGELEKKLESSRKSGALPKVLIAVHFGGYPADMAEIRALCSAHGINVIEDASHALGAIYRDGRIGSCAFSDAAIFSFKATKNITTGEGGMVLTNRTDVAKRMVLLREGGVERTHSNDEDEPWRRAQTELGFNYRLTDMQAALGSSQLRKLESFVARRDDLARRYDESLRDLPGVQLPQRSDDRRPAWHLYPVQLRGPSRAERRRALFLALREENLPCQVHYPPIHTQPYYAGKGFRKGDFPVAERYYEGALSLPFYVDLAKADQDRTIEIVRSVVSEK